MVRAYRKSVKTSAAERSSYDVTSGIIEFESGQLDDQGVLKLFSELVKSGLVWNLQGSYGRMAASLIDAGYLDREGNILKEPEA